MGINRATTATGRGPVRRKERSVQEPGLGRVSTDGQGGVGAALPEGVRE